MHPAKQRAKAILDKLQGVENPVVVELGVFLGALSRELLAQRPDLTLYMIAAWGDNDSQDYKETGDFHANASQEQQNQWEKNTRDNVKEFGDRAKIVKGLTTEVAKQFSKGFFDLVFIDADHSYKGCKEDILAWKDKVKKGGYISGHDYNNFDFDFGVNQAVDEWLPKGKELEFGLNFTWFVKC